MTRGPAVRFPSALQARYEIITYVATLDFTLWIFQHVHITLSSDVKEWLSNEKNFADVKEAFDSTSR